MEDPPCRQPYIATSGCLALILLTDVSNAYVQPWHTILYQLLPAKPFLVILGHCYLKSASHKLKRCAARLARVPRSAPACLHYMHAALMQA